MKFTDRIIRQIKSVLVYKGGSAQVIKGGAVAFIIKFFGTLLVFVVQVLISRLIGAKDYGTYNLALSWLNILVLFCILGLDTALLKFIPIYNASKEWGKLCGLLKKCNQITLYMSLLISGISILIMWNSFFGLTAEIKKTFMIAFCILPILAFSRVRSAALRAFKFPGYSLLPQQVFRPFILGMIAITFSYCVSFQLKSFHFMCFNCCAMLLSLIISDFWLRKRLPFKFALIIPVYKNREWLKVSLPLLFISGMELLLKRIDVLMIGAISGSKAAGIYSADIRISSFVAFGLASLNIIVAPMISQLYAVGDFKQLQKILSVVSKLNFIFVVLVMCLMVLLGKSILSIFGSEFTVGYVALIILVIGQVINSLAGPVGLLMTMTGRQVKAAKILGITVVANVTMNSVFIYFWGITGAALATSCAILIWNVGLLYHIYKHIKLNPTIFHGFTCKKTQD